jgi:hypothetical protein
MDNTTLDGNAAGGILREIFPFEMTLAEGTCAHCGSTRVVGERHGDGHALSYV